MMSIFKYIVVVFFVFIGISSAQNWRIHSRMPLPVSGAEVFVDDETIYILGGYSDSLQHAVDWIQAYSPVENSWRIVGNMNTPRYGFVAARSADSIIYICGGVWSNTDNLSALEQWPLNTSDGNNPEIRTNNATFNRRFASGYIFGDHLFLIGGLPFPDASIAGHLSYIVRYQISNAQLASIQDTLYNSNAIPYHQMTAKIGNIVYLFGGVHFGISNGIFAFNLENYSYSEAGEMTRGRAGGSVVWHGEKVYLIGGYNESDRALATIDIFTLNNRKAAHGPQLNFRRTESMAVHFGEDIYVFGGKDQFGNTVPWIETLPLTATTSSMESRTPSPDNFQLHQNHPNPFNAATTIEFNLPHNENVSLDIYTIEGKFVTRILSGLLPGGAHHERWDGNDQFGNAVASGIYVYKLQTASYLYARKMILIR